VWFSVGSASRTASFDAVERPPDAAAATTAVESSTTTPRPT